jgi:hypothetical protein
MRYRLFTFLIAVALATISVAQDRIEYINLNGTHRTTVRTKNYYPDHGAFVCVDGKNKYTRALYGSTTEYRIDTSDRPIFGIYKKNSCRNIRIFLDNAPLDSMPCKSSYKYGERIYQLDGLSVMVIAVSDIDGGLFLIESHGQKGTLRIEISRTKTSKFLRNGDMGVDAPDAFDPAGKPVSVLETGLKDKLCLQLIGTDSLHIVDAVEYARESERQQKHFRTLSIDSPDSFVNAAVAALAPAAEGIWDGNTFRHGAVGWRTELAGWRGAYVGDVLGWDERAKAHFTYYAGQQIKDVPAVLAHPTQDSTKNLARADKKWGTQMYSNGYITSNRKLNHYDMNLVYIDELLWHFQYDADTVYMRRMWPTIKLSLDWEKRNFDPDGDHLYDAYACIWASDALYYNGGAATHSTAYNYRANFLAAKIARLLGEDARPYQNEADAILKAMNSTLWLSDKCYWAEYKDLMGLRRVHDNAALWTIYTAIDSRAGSSEQMYGSTFYVDSVIPHKYWTDADDGNRYAVLSTSNWRPYAWSINNVACAENYHMALAYFEAGRKEEGYRLLKSTMMDNMYYGKSPGNYGQISYFDESRGECYRDFADCIGIASRAIVQGLFGIQPNALDGKCYIRPGFPDSWDNVRITTPYLSYSYSREKGVYDIEQNFPQHLEIIVETGQTEQVMPDVAYHIRRSQPSIPYTGEGKEVNLTGFYNSRTDDLYKNEYLSPRPKVTTLQIPVQGAGDWCSTNYKPELHDASPIIYTSLWDNYPDSVTIPLKGRYEAAEMIFFGTTNWMQSSLPNAIVTFTYSDGSATTLELINPDNWLPMDTDVPIAVRLDKRKHLRSMTLRTLSNDVVIGIKKLKLK